VDVAASLPRYLFQSRFEKVMAYMVCLPAAVRVHDHLDAPGPVAAAHLGVTDERPAASLTRNETREPGTSPMDQVEPLVLSERSVLVGPGCRVEQQRHLRDVVFAHPSFYFYVCHRV
jgi:hypothetical protein